MKIALLLFISGTSCYVIFVFIAESVRLFTPPKGLSQRKRYKLGRRIAFTLFLSSLTMLFTNPSSLLAQMAQCVLVATPFLGGIIYWHRTTDVFGRRRVDTGQ